MHKARRLHRMLEDRFGNFWTRDADTKYTERRDHRSNNAAIQCTTRDARVEGAREINMKFATYAYAARDHMLMRISHIHQGERIAAA